MNCSIVITQLKLCLRLNDKLRSSKCLVSNNFQFRIRSSLGLPITQIWHMGSCIRSLFPRVNPKGPTLVMFHIIKTGIKQCWTGIASGIDLGFTIYYYFNVAIYNIMPLHWCSWKVAKDKGKPLAQCIIRIHLLQWNSYLHSILNTT